MSEDEFFHIRLAIGAFTNATPSQEIVKAYYETDSIELQDWVGEYIRSEFFWSTNIGIIEAAEHIVKEAYANGNIK